MTTQTRHGGGAKSKRRPVRGNSPNDRILRDPDCCRPKRVCADAFPATLSPRPPRIEGIPRMRFSGMTESIGPMCSQNQNHANLRAGCRLPLVGPRAPVKGRDGRTAPYPSSTMSSGRLFLDRVARQHCPSPLHRHGQNNMHPLPAPAEPDISTLQRIGHFYFALTAPAAGTTFYAATKAAVIPPSHLASTRPTWRLAVAAPLRLRHPLPLFSSGTR